jgi:hypothetical protein
MTFSLSRASLFSVVHMAIILPSWHFITADPHLELQIWDAGCRLRGALRQDASLKHGRLPPHSVMPLHVVPDLPA